MKALQTLAFVSVLLFLLAPQVGATEIASSAAFESASCLIDGGPSLPAFMLPVEASWGQPSLPSCFLLEDTYCSTPGLPGIRCMWQPGEPGICFCQSNHTLRCG